MNDERKPVFLLAGGRAFRERRSPDPIIKAVFKYGGVESPVIGYIGAAANDDERFFSYMANYLTEAGARKIVHARLVADNADIELARKQLIASDIVFVSGGDVERGMEVLRQKDMVEFLYRLYEEGKLFFGVSAGSIMLAKEWVRWRDPDDDSTAELFPCLNIAPVICDTHAEEDGWPELKAALELEPPNTHGYGIASGAAITVFPDGRVTAAGGSVHRFVRRSDGVERLPDLLPLKV